MRHAKNWYKFAYPWTGVSNRSLCLITGCDKMSSWMVGAFSDCSSGSQAVLQLSVSGLLEGQLSYSYAWATSSPAIQRVGPSVDQTIATDADPDGLERDDEMFTTDPPQGSNQCAFIRGYTITRREGLWPRIIRRQRTTIQISSIENATEGDIRRNSVANTAQSSWQGGGGRDSSGELWGGEPDDDSLSDKDDIRLEEIPSPCEVWMMTCIRGLGTEKY